MNRVILLGVNGFGAQWVKPCSANGLEIVAVVDNYKEARESAHTQMHVPVSNIFDGSNNDWAGIEAEYAIEATSPGGRVERITAALRSGKHVIVAKPPVLCIEDMHHIIDVSNKCGKQLHVVTQKRYFPAFSKIKDIISSEALGNLVYADINLRVDGTFWKSGFYWRKRLPYPSLIDGSIHHFDLMRWWTGSTFKSVMAASWNTCWSPFDNDCDFSGIIRMNNGAVINYTSRWSMKHGPVINYFDGVRLEYLNDVLEVVDGKLYRNGEYIPLTNDGRTLMDTEELNIHILKDILETINSEGTDDTYNTSAEYHLEPFRGVIGTVASLVNKRETEFEDLEERLNEYCVSGDHFKQTMAGIFERS